ncbi:MAG TPA: phosphoribosyltransferase family protein [Thermoanaerobaculia bacterium]
MMVFANRSGAGRQLAQSLMAFAGRDVVVLALPRGGVPVAYEVADALGAPLDVFVVRSIPVAGGGEEGVGAIATGGAVVLNDHIVTRLGLPAAELQSAVELERAEVARREIAYRGLRPPIDVRAKTVILVHDGIATGEDMCTAIRALRQLSPARVIAAVPVSSQDGLRALRAEADDVVCLSTPYDFRYVSLWYMDFPHVSDGEIRQLLALANEHSERSVLIA